MAEDEGVMEDSLMVMVMVMMGMVGVMMMAMIAMEVTVGEGGVAIVVDTVVAIEATTS